MIHTGDCVAVMASMPDNSVDAVVCDPPYGLEFMGKEWDSLRLGPVRKGNPFDASKAMRDNGRPRSKADPWATERTGYGAPNKMPKCAICGKWKYNGNKTSQCACPEPQWVYDTSSYPRKMQEWHQAWATEALRVAKPGAYLLAFGGTRTYHRLAVAVEDAGWIIRDCLVWAYAQGFPKSRALLKPAWEPIVMARKPGPLRELAIDACRIPGALDGDPDRFAKTDGGTFASFTTPPVVRADGRWPANVVLTDPIFDGDVEGVVGGGETSSGKMMPTPVQNERTVFGSDAVAGYTTIETYGDTGTYSRFFLIPKSARAEREPLITPEGHDKTTRFTTHPTIKPLDLMRHLVRLVTPSGGTVLDPFLGSGTTAIAAEMEGFAWIGIEREPEYVAIAEARLMGVQKGLGLTA